MAASAACTPEAATVLTAVTNNAFVVVVVTAVANTKLI